ncbi:hypothetical protein, partial [Methylacidiphilum caldifontis]|uniref:hypothetical protein n=1 Tax=Methylacidiphilum caldifontis TaxID=2795386 RepID=UPI001068FCBB
MGIYRQAGGADPRWWAVSGFLPALSAVLFWPIRPETATYLAFGVLLYLIARVRAGDWRWGWGLPLLTWIWANFHASFMLALVFIAIEAGLAWIPFTFGRIVNPPVAPALRVRWLIWLALSGIAGALTPHGLGFYQYAVTMSTDNPMRHVITEWASPDFHAAFFLIWLLMGVGGLIWSWQSSEPVPAWWVIYSVGLTYGFLDSVRWLPYATVATPLWLAPLTRRQPRTIRWV